MPFKIQTLNPIAPAGMQRFSKKNYKIKDHHENTADFQPDALLVRSHTMHHMDIPNSVKIVGRAGAGTNNIPIDRLTERGIPVLNTPGANANAVKELVLTGILLACRHICRAWDYGRQLEGDDQALHLQVEQNKKHFSGTELPGKTLAVIGLGNIGVKVANAAMNLGMHVVGFDQGITVNNAWQLSANIKRADTLKEALADADFISLHIPLLESTTHLIDKKCFSAMKPGAVLLNFARDGIVDNEALVTALADGQLQTYVCDFINRRLKDHPNVIALPHLGASTREAEENCAIMIAHQVQDFLEHGHIQHAVNFPDVKLPHKDGYRLAITNKNVPNIIAQLSTTLSDANINIIDMLNKSRGDIAYNLLDVNADIDTALLTTLNNIDGVIKARKVY